MLKTVYLEAVQTLAKATRQRVPRPFVSRVNAAHDAQEPKTLRAVRKVVARARRRFLSRFKVDPIAEKIGTVQKADDNSNQDAEDEIRKILKAAFADASAEVVVALEPLVEELAQNYKTVASIDLNFRVISQQAVSYLRDHADNYFTTFADDQAEGIHKAIAEEMASEDGYTVKTIVANIRKAFLVDYLYFPTASGTRKVSVDDWSLAVARTETARAASFAQRATLDSLDLKTWQWLVQATGCEDCQDNDDEIVTVGDAFPSGATEPPQHPNCRCVVIPVMDELLSAEDDE